MAAAGNLPPAGQGTGEGRNGLDTIGSMSFAREPDFPPLATDTPAHVPSGRMPTLIQALRQQESLRAVIESISVELDLRPLLTRIASSACELLDAWDAGIGLYDPDRGVIRMEACYRMPANELGAEFERGVGLAGAVLEQRRPVVFDSYRDVPNATREDRKPFAVVGVPIAWRNRLIGFFGIGAKPPRRFDPNDVETLTLFGRHAAIAIANARRYEEERRRARRWSLVAHVGRAITAGLELRALLRTAADAIHEHLGYPHVALPIVDAGDPSRLLLEAVAGQARETITDPIVLPADSGLLGDAIRERRVQRIDDLSSDRRRNVPLPGLPRMRSALAVPILLGSEVLGVVDIGSASPTTEEDVASLRVVADHLAVAIANARLFLRARRAAVLEERQRIARDLHDSVSQMLFSTSLLAQSIMPTLERDPPAGEALILQVIERSRATQVEMRSLLRELQPAEDETDPADDPSTLRIRRDGLVPTLRDHIAAQIGTGLTVEVDDSGYPRQPHVQEETLFRIACEALHNVVKHARAQRVRIRLGADADTIRLDVSDDGVGLAEFPIEGEVPGRGLGVRGMGQRAAQLGGRCTVANRPEGGVVVQVLLPRPSRLV